MELTILYRFNYSIVCGYLFQYLIASVETDF